MNKVKLVGFLIVALSLAFASVPSSGMEGSDADIRGTITRIRRASAEDESRFIGTVLIEGDKEANAKPDKANLIVTNETRIFARRGEERRQAAFEDLTVGDVVEAQFVEGPTVMMYPLQVGASEIVILNRGRAKE